MMWKHSSVLVCALAALLLNSSVAVKTTNDPSTLPLIQFDDLNYVGAFRVPSQSSNGHTFEIGGHPTTYNPVRNSLYMGSRLGHLAEISIPQPVNSSDVTKLPRASFIQGFFDPAEGHLSGFPGTGIAVDGVLVYGDRLYGTASVYYDANNEQRVSHFSRSLTLNQASFRGWSSVWSPEKAGFVSGYMALVPPEWQAALGGPAITGQFGTPIVWRTSWGPAAFAFNPTLIGNSLVPAAPLVYYDSEHQTLGPWSSSNPVYGATTDKGGVAIIAGSRTLLFFGRNGTGPYCYGNGTSDQLLVGKIGSDGAHWCYDPTNAAKGPHAYPYRYQIWAYDLNELAKVKRGEKRPWDVKPYGVWPFDLPTPEPSVRIAGLGYDSATQTIYLTQMRAEKDGYANRPVVHVLRVGGVGGSPLPSPSDEPAPDSGSDPLPPPPTTTSSKVSSVTISASKPSPQPPGTAMTLTAVPNGGAAPQQYKWWQHDGTRWNAITSWSTSNTYAWTPTATGAYRFGVWVRSAGATSDAAEANVNFDFSISGTATSSPSPAAPKVSSVGIAANRAAPQPPGTQVTFTGVPIGGGTPVQMKWRVYNGTSWTTVQSWSTATTFTWTPSTANSSYRVEVSARSAGVATDTAEASMMMDFPIVNSTTTTAPSPSSEPPPSTSSTVTALTMTASAASPQAPGTTIAFSATPVGGIAPHQYEWWLYDGLGWRVVRGWSTSNSYAWTPTVASNSYKINVKVRSANKTSNIEEAKASMSFAISTTEPPSSAPPPTTEVARATAVTLTANKPSPQVRGTAITWTASNVAGGVAPFQYKFYVWNGAGWIVGRGWSTSNTFTWIPTLANPYYKVAVWVRSSGNTSDDYEISATSPLFAIK